MIETYLEENARIIQEKLETILQECPSVPTEFLDAMRYSITVGGKRLRPILVLATVEALGKNTEIAYPFACAIEMIHTYSLIHDDLPCMDDDDYRRGQLTNHKKYGEATAVLAGDALLTEAFGLMAQGTEQANLQAKIGLTIIKEAAKHAGARGMVGGQFIDLQSENQIISLEDLKQIHRYKTGELIAFSVRTGAHLAQASEEALEALTRFAYGLGLAFQIQDDILDVIGDPSLIGKPVGSDEEKHKATYPALLGLEESQRRLSTLTDEAKGAILGVEEINPDRLLAIADYLLIRDK